MEPNYTRSISHHPHLFSLPTVPPVSSLHGPGRPRNQRKSIPKPLEKSSSVAQYPPESVGDVELQSVVDHAACLIRHNDVYNFLSSYKSPSDLLQIKADAFRKLRDIDITRHSWILHIPFFDSALRTQRLCRFYERQNAAIERMLKTVDEHRSDARKEATAEAIRLKIAIYGSLGANVFLSALQVFAAVTSGSLSLITTMADAVFDPLSNVMLILSNRATYRVDPARFPSGRARLETAGNIVFCFIMIAVSILIIAFSIRELSDRAGKGGVNGFHISSVIAVTVSFTTKFGLFIYCFALRNGHSQVRIIWQDHRNDLLINGFGILTCVGGSKLIWWIDPAGAIVLSVLIASLWLRTAWIEFMLIVGVAASVETQQLITYICLTHSESIFGIDTVRVYYSGPRLIVEVDVVMDRNASLNTIHDIAEALQFKLESLPNVERSYVHVDYETTHKPEHAYRKEL